MFNLKKGFSLIEMIIAIAIIGIIVAISFPAFSGIKNAQILKGSAGDIMSAINKARAQTLASLDGAQYGVRFETNRVIIFTGINYDANSVSNKIINLAPATTISSVSLGGGVSEIYFTKLTGLPNKTGTITVSISSNQSLSKTITISATGSVSSS